jgi:hypothetical protein
MQHIVLGILMLLISVGFYLATVHQLNQMIYKAGWLILPTILAGCGGMFMIIDDMNTHDLYGWNLIVSFVSMWLFLLLAYHFMFKSARILMFTMLISMFISISACSISLVGFGGQNG